MKVTLDGLSKFVVNWIMRAGDLVLDKDREVMEKLKTVYIIDEVRYHPHTVVHSYDHLRRLFTIIIFILLKLFLTGK
jgi:hypothetical protein